MTKNAFLEELRMALSSRIAAQEVTEHLRYYEDYINTQIRMGREEAEVLDKLGDPRLLARNIAESKKYAADGSRKNEKENYHTSGYNDRNNTYAENSRMKKTKIPGWLWIVIIVAIVLIFFALCFSILSFLSPVLIPLVIILLWIRFLRKTS